MQPFDKDNKNNRWLTLEPDSNLRLIQQLRKLAVLFDLRDFFRLYKEMANNQFYSSRNDMTDVHLNLHYHIFMAISGTLETISFC